MNPTIKQLSLWSAEVLDYEITYMDSDKEKTKPFVKFNKRNNGDGMTIWSLREWHPATDLSQAWREFVSVLLRQGSYVCLETIWRGRIGCALTNPRENFPDRIGARGYGETSDQKAAYALTYAFVKAFADKSPGYQAWKDAA